MEPRIYEPYIYNGAGIYNTGAEGGGGGLNLPDYIKLVSWLRQVSNSPIEGFPVNVNTTNEDIYEITLFPLFGTNLQLSMVSCFQTSGVGRLLEINTQSSYSDGIRFKYENGGMSRTETIGNSTIKYGIKIKLFKDKFEINGSIYNLNGTFSGIATGPLVRIWANEFYPMFTYPFVRFTIFDKDGNKKNDFLPVKNTNDNTFGVFDIVGNNYTQSFNFTGGTDIIE